MVETRILLMLTFLFIFILGCSEKIAKSEIQIPLTEPSRQEVKHSKDEKSVPDFRVDNIPPVDPLKIKKISINVKSAPLREVLIVFAKDAGLNLIFENDVSSEIPITLVLKDVTMREALDAIMASTDYFYNIERNTLRIAATETRVFHMNIFPIHQTYSVDVGGDILGGVTGALTAGATAAGGTTGLKGNVTKSERSDDTAYKIWDSIEKALSSIIGVSGPAAAGLRSAAPPLPSEPGAVQSGQIRPVAPITESFVVNRVTGTIVVTATKKKMAKVEQYLNSIKEVMGRQVLIEAKVIEVGLSDALRYGIDWSFLGQWSHGTKNWSVKAGMPLSSYLPTVSPYSDLRFTLTTTAIKDFSLIVKALAEFGDVRTLSNPRINIMNGQTSILTVGRNTTFISKAQSNITTSATGGTILTYTVETSNLLSGLIMGIVPYIDEKGEITLTITPVTSNLVSINEKALGSLESQTVIQLPVVDLRDLSTTVKVKDGEVVIIGGLIKKEEHVLESKTPLLGDIPLLGYLFRGKDKSLKNTELVILLQPRIISK
ncbi:MAG: pilus (MSHA type) biogenesis protein MshL [Syntrophales bacterium]|nr:pilus (MSHA type) biogenesis protein MshL [Syntrophales bacterium]